MPRVVALNQTNVSLRIRVLDDSDGTPKTDLLAATSGHLIWYQRGYDNAVVTDSGSAADMTALTDAHTDWEFKHIQEGWYRVDMPDACFAENEGSVIVGMNATGFTGISETVTIEPLYKYQGTASSVTSTTTTFPSGTTPLKGDVIMVLEGTGEPGNQVLVTSVSGEVATHGTFATGVSATTTTLLLIAGDAITAQGGINSDAASSTLATPAQVNTECDTAISDAALATADKLLGYVQLAARSDSAIETDRVTELNEINNDESSGAGDYSSQTDSQEKIAADVAATLVDTVDIQSRIPAALSGGGNITADIQEVDASAITTVIPADTKKINGATVSGAGTSGDKWRG